MYLERDKTENLLEVQDIKEKTKDTTKITYTKQTTKAASTNTNTDKNIEETRRNSLQAAHLKTVKPRKRYSTFTIGDVSNEEILSENNSEPAKKKEDSDSVFDKQRTFSFMQPSKWRKSHSFHEILKTSPKVSGTTPASPSLNKEIVPVPTITLTKHDSSHISSGLSRVPEQSNPRLENIKSLHECKKIMKESVSSCIYLTVQIFICICIESK